jgi:hypothetical protein
VLIDQQNGAETARNRLFVDVVHTTLMRLIGTDEPAAPDVFVVNFSIGVLDSHFSGRISALALLMDWWAAKEGLLFVISAGNVGHLTLPRNDDDGRRKRCRRRPARNGPRRNAQLHFQPHLLAPAESLNALTVGALSLDLANNVPPQQAGILKLEGGRRVRAADHQRSRAGLPAVYKARFLRGGRLPGGARHAAGGNCKLASGGEIQPHGVGRGISEAIDQRGVGCEFQGGVLVLHL